MNWQERLYGFRVTMREDACAVLAGELPAVEGRSVVLTQPTDSAVVFGSSQRPDSQQTSRCESAGFTVARRMSGGGGVVIVPGEVVWVDLFVPVDDPLYDRDVRSGSSWVGRLWLDTFTSLGMDASLLAVHRGGLVESQWSKLSCFTGLGPGEVTYAGRKIMGLSQRRTRDGAWYFSLVYRSFDAARDAQLLAASAEDVTGLETALRDQIKTVDADSSTIVATLMSALRAFA